MFSLLKGNTPDPGELYVVVQSDGPGVDPYVSSPRLRDEALRMFDGLLRSCPPGVLSPERQMKIRVLTLAEWTRQLRETVQSEYTGALTRAGA